MVRKNKPTVYPSDRTILQTLLELRSKLSELLVNQCENRTSITIANLMKSTNRLPDHVAALSIDQLTGAECSLRVLKSREELSRRLAVERHFEGWASKCHGNCAKDDFVKVS